MSSFAVKVERILDIYPHSNADRLEVAQILGWRCIVGKGEFQVGDLCVYFPIDSILPPPVEDEIFGQDSKIRLSKSRVRTIKLRGEISQGLAVSTALIGKLLYERPTRENAFYEGQDLTDLLAVTKYEPPQKDIPSRMQGGAVSWKRVNPNFLKYSDIENSKNYPDIFMEGEPVVITEKIHGTNFRVGWVPVEVNTWWKKLKQVFGVLNPYEFVYGSRQVQMQHRYNGGNTTFYQQTGALKKNVYADIVDRYNLRSRIPKGYVLYGEIYGWGIQKNYHYDCKMGEHKVMFFDLMNSNTGQYEPFYKFYQVVREELELPIVPILGVHKAYNNDLISELREGQTTIPCATQAREGIVVKTPQEEVCRIGRKILKFINDEYLLREQSDFH